MLKKKSNKSENPPKKKNYKKTKKMIVAVVCRSFFFSGSCFCHCLMEVVFVEWSVYVVAGSCFFNDSDTAVVSKKCCSMTGLHLLLLPLVCCFLLQKLKKATYYFAVFVLWSCFLFNSSFFPPVC